MKLAAADPAGTDAAGGDALPFPLAPGAARYFGADGSYLVARDQIDGDALLMPVVIRSRGPFRLLRCTFAPVRADGGVPAVEQEQAFLNRFLDHVRAERPCHRIGQPDNWALFRSAPGGSVGAPFGSYRVPLVGRDIEDVVAAFKPRFRSYVREGTAAGAVLRTGPEALDAFYELHAATMERAGLYLAPRSQFERLLAAFGEVADVGVVEADGVAAAGELAMTTRYGTFVTHGGTSREAPNYAGKFLKARMMARSIERGAAFYDFVGARLSDVGGTSVAGVQQFKSGFGAELVAGLLWKADVDLVRCAALDALQRVRGKTAPDIIDQERSRAARLAPGELEARLVARRGRRSAGRRGRTSSPS